MKIQNYITICGVMNKNTNKTVHNQSKNCSFRAELYTDESYTPGSIFDLMAKRDAERRFSVNEFVAFENDVGHKPTDEFFKNLKINALSYVGNNVHKGSMRDAAKCVDQLKKHGVKEMIVLCNPSECNIIAACKEVDMPYTLVYTPHSLDQDFINKYFEQDFKSSSFVRAVQLLREGNVFVGCESGNLRTNKFLQVVKILDPENKLSLGEASATKNDYILASTIWKMLSSAEKNLLNYTKESEQKLITTLERYVH